jgi:hypothetical protein
VVHYQYTTNNALSLLPHLSTLLLFILSLYRYCRGLERLREYWAIFALTWGLLLPFVIFQALLCARDDHQHGFYGHNNAGDPHQRGMPTATETVAPVLVLLGWVCMVSTLVSFSMKTAYQVCAF